jgi:hypothetical protein
MSPTAVWALRWCDVDPSARGFDPRAAREIAARVLAGRAPAPTYHPGQPNDARLDELEREIDAALIAEYGFWAAGWRWASSEPGGGGPVHAYCCAQHSLREGHGATDIVVTALCDWRQWLETLAIRFTELRRAHEGLALAEATDRAAASLVVDIVQRTEANDAWYGTFATVIAWYLEPVIEDDRERARLIRDAIGGRFESWCAPPDATVAAVSTSIGTRTAEAIRSPRAPSDALQQWLEVRARTRWRTDRVHPLRDVHDDGHLRYVRNVERSRDPLRADRMAEAIALARRSAQRGAPLDVAMLCRWQATVLGEPSVAVRTTDAYAKRGRERYGTPPDLESKLESYLAEACRDDAPAAVRAARVYLDVLFLHPFRDGNARAARLALDHVLTREALALHVAEPILVVARTALDGHGAVSFQFLVELLTGSRSSQRSETTRR